MDRDRVRRARDEVRHLAGSGLDWVRLSAAMSEVVARLVPFDRSCWHTVDPGTVLFTGSVNRNIACSGSWLAEYEYVVEDVNKWWFLARSGRRAGAMSLATHGDLSRSARHRSQETYGIGDELRASFVADGTYWGAAGFLRDSDRPWFTEADVAVVAALSDGIADALRRALLAAVVAEVVPADQVPGVVVFDEHGAAMSVSPAAERWIAELVEIPAPVVPSESKVVQAVAARVRTMSRTGSPPLAARARVRTRTGTWLVVHGTPLSGATDGRTAVIIQPAGPYEVAPLIALSHGLTEREAQITRLCVEGRPTKVIATELHMSPYTVQDHLKSIFEKTGVRSRNELVGQIFLQHYATRWEDVPGAPSGWRVQALPELAEPELAEPELAEPGTPPR
jgi:DNA-binding CsgD family transcriptional regulator